jgi:hypothetical protein
MNPRPRPGSAQHWGQTTVSLGVHRITPRGGVSSRQACRLPLRPESFHGLGGEGREGFAAEALALVDNDAICEVPTGIQQAVGEVQIRLFDPGGRPCRSSAGAIWQQRWGAATRVPLAAVKSYSTHSAPRGKVTASNGSTAISASPTKLA